MLIESKRSQKQSRLSKASKSNQGSSMSSLFWEGFNVTHSGKCVASKDAKTSKDLWWVLKQQRKSGLEPLNLIIKQHEKQNEIKPNLEDWFTWNHYLNFRWETPVHQEKHSRRNWRFLLARLQTDHHWHRSACALYHRNAAPYSLLWHIFLSSSVHQGNLDGFHVPAYDVPTLPLLIVQPPPFGHSVWA